MGNSAEDPALGAAAQQFSVPVLKSETGTEYIEDTTYCTYFIIGRFEGPEYEALHKTPHRILGPTALLQLAEKKESLPSINRPMYTQAMLGTVVVFTGFRKKDELVITETRFSAFLSIFDRFFIPITDQTHQHDTQHGWQHQEGNGGEGDAPDRKLLRRRQVQVRGDIQSTDHVYGLGNGALGGTGRAGEPRFKRQTGTSRRGNLTKMILKKKKFDLFTDRDTQAETVLRSKGLLLRISRR